jgi:DNA-binding MarR family transcriptional regulator
MRKDLERLEVAGERLAKIFRSRRSSERRAARAELELPGAAQNVLRCVVKCGPCRVSGIARVTGSGNPAVSRIVAQLESNGLVVRVPDAADGRAVQIRATRSGQATARRLRRAADRIFEEHLREWADRDVTRLADLLERLCRDLSEER